MFSDTMQSPIGFLEIKASSQGISLVDFSEVEISTIPGNAITALCKQQLQEYFAGERKVFDLPLDPQGSVFQKSVWQCLSRIPFGTAVSYGDIADRLQNRQAVRAVGAANGKNPIAIIVPCHRVIGADRSLTGYAGGLARKAWLLEHEGIQFKTGVKNKHPAEAHIFQTDLFDNIEV